MVLASDIIVQVAGDLRDTGFVRWTKADHYQYITAAKRTLVMIRPDAFSVTVPFCLIPFSTRQQLPSNGVSVIDIVRNMGADGNTPGAPVTVTTKAALDESNINWHTDTWTTEVTNFCFDERSNRSLFITPPPANGVFVELVYSKLPVPVVADTDVIDTDDIFFTVLIDYCLFKAYSRNNDSQGDAEKAKMHLATFLSALGQSQQASMLMSPNTSTLGTSKEAKK